MVLRFWPRSKTSASSFEFYFNPAISKYFTFTFRTTSTSTSYVTYNFNYYTSYKYNYNNCNILTNKTGTGNTGYIFLLPKSKSKLLAPSSSNLFPVYKSRGIPIPACNCNCHRHHFSDFVKKGNNHTEMSLEVGNINNNNVVEIGDVDDKKLIKNADLLKDIIEIEGQYTEDLTDQVSGHSTNLILKYKCQDRSLVLKPVQKPPYGEREVSFYRTVFEKNKNDCEIHQQLEQLIPKFHGLCRIKGSDKGVYMILDDILEGFTSSCAVDVKIGSKTWDPSASPQKINHERSKYPGTKGPLGLSITGMQYYCATNTNHGSGDISNADSPSKSLKLIKYDKEFGKNLIESTIPQAFIEFFQNQTNLMEICLKKLIKIQDFFHTQNKEYAFYSSSLLITYDANNAIAVPENGQGQGQENDQDQNLQCQSVDDLVRIYMIDFAHVFQNNGQLDDNYIHGLDNLVNIFKKILLK